MNSAQLKALQDLNLATNSNNAITAAKLREFTTDLIKGIGGWVFYQNSSSTKQSITADTETQLTNNGAGAETLLTYKPYYVESALLSSNAVQLSELALGSIVHGRFSSQITTTSNNTEIKLRAKFKNSGGTVISTYDFANIAFKNQGNHSINQTGVFFVANGFENGSIEFYAEADHNFQILWTDLTLDIR